MPLELDEVVVVVVVPPVDDVPVDDVPVPVVVPVEVVPVVEVVAVVLSETVNCPHPENVYTKVSVAVVIVSVPASKPQAERCRPEELTVTVP